MIGWAFDAAASGLIEWIPIDPYAVGLQDFRGVGMRYRLHRAAFCIESHLQNFTISSYGVE